MYIDLTRNNGKKYLRLVNSIRVINKDGYSVPQKKVMLNLGPLDKFDDGKPDYVQRLRDSFKNGNPLIPTLKEYCVDKAPLESYSIEFQQGSPLCFGQSKLYSHCLIERIMSEIGLDNLCRSYKHFSKINFDLYGFVKLLVFGRILNPASKASTVKQNSDYYEPILNNFNEDNIYDTLDFIYENESKIIRRINTHMINSNKRKTDLIYYAVTNFYFEIEDPDDDMLNDSGETIEKGIRKNGVSKEERKQPIVQMGMFMDNNGIPISIETFPGNTLDHLTVLPSLKSSIDDIEFSRFIFVGDRGICTYPVLYHLLNSNNGYIVAKSILKSNIDEKKWITDEKGYVYRGNDFKYKSRIVRKTIEDENKEKHIINEKVVSYWSKNFEERSKKENKKFLDFLDSFLENPTNFRVSSSQSASLRKFFKKEYLNKKNGEKINSSELIAMLDMNKVEEYKKYFGYYQIVTSELEMDDLDIIDKYHGLSRIEDQFRVMKGDLNTRPVWVRTKEHIAAHLMICFIGLVIMRIIQLKTIPLMGKTDSRKLNWTYGLSACRVQIALNKWKVNTLPDDYYQFLDVDDEDLSIILKAFKINIEPKLYRRGELKRIKTGIEKIL